MRCGAAAATPFDAVTLDRLLPDGDGLAVVERLRAAGISAPVLMLSALSDVDQRIAGLRAGGDDYLPKPFSPMSPSPNSRHRTAIALVVEDEPLQRMDMCDLVEEAGFEAVLARDADHAIAILTERLDITIVFTDIDMPGSMNGLKLAAAIRER